MATHTLIAYTRMEDLTGLASGDTISLNGHVLTCETDLSAKTGLYATGTGTIRLLDGGNCDFSGSNPLPATVTLEGGTEENPLPAHGDYGYPLRAAACIKNAANIFAGQIISHCEGNASRVPFARTIASSAGSMTLDRPVDWESGDALLLLKSDGSATLVTADGINHDTRVVTLSTTANAGVGTVAALATAGFVLQGASANGVYTTGPVSGDELGTVQVGTNWRAQHFAGNVDVGRIVAPYTGDTLFSTNAIRVGTLVSGMSIAYSSSNPAADIGRIVGARIASGPARVRAFGGVIAASNALSPTYGRVELCDVELPAALYSSLGGNSELFLRTTEPRTCVVHRAGGLATLVQRADFAVPTSLPDAWFLSPVGDGTAWHDEPVTVRPGETLAVQWYAMLGEDGATAGVQILDGEFPGFGSMALGMGLAECFAEYAIPAATEALRWIPPVNIAWRNTSQRTRKIVLRGWARGGSAYSRIGTVQGGIA
jgi:hypothetical protein